MKPRRIRLATLFGCALALLTTAAGAADFYVAPNGIPSGSGSISSPWDLQTALNQPSAVHPGAKIWLRGGVYHGIFNSRLVGTPTAPIIVRQYPGERAIIDGGNSNGAGIFQVAGSYTWFWGFEVMSSYGHRTSAQTGSSPTDILYGDGIQIDQSTAHPGLKFINMIIHDTRQGISYWQNATDSEFYGNLVYYNGWNAPDRPHGHGIYSQNTVPSTRMIRDNIFYANYDYQLQMYGSNAHLDNHVIDGNIGFWDGAADTAGPSASMNMGGALSSTGNSLTSNAFYGSPHGGSLDFSRGNQNVTMTGNLVGGALASNCTQYCLSNGLHLERQTGVVNISGNKFYSGQISPSNYASLHPSNTYWLDPSRPTGTWVLVRPNAYEAGRGHVAVFNWGHAASVSVDLSSILSVGSTFAIHNAQNYFGSPVLTVTYAGGIVSIPMTGSSVETPIGTAAPGPTGPEFNAFVVQAITGGCGDDFRRADGPLGPGWMLAAGDVQIKSGQAVNMPRAVTTANLAVMPRCQGATYGSAAFTVLADGGAFGIVLGYRDGRTYWVGQRITGGTAVVRIVRVSGGVETVLVSKALANPVSLTPLPVSFSADGSVLTATAGGQTVTATDGSFTPGAAGIRIISRAGQAADNFVGR